MDYKLEDLIDIKLLQDLQEKLDLVYSFPSAVIDNDGKILTAVAWQDICTKFHRMNPECENECIKSDQYILDHLHEAIPAVSYECPHGLTDNAIPIVIDGKHLGNFFTGQFFLKKPDLHFFREQAKKYGFDEEAYLEAVKKVPIWTKEKLLLYLDFIKGFIEIIAGIGLNHLKEIETNKRIKESELKYRSLIEHSSDAIFCVDENGYYKFVNQLFASTFGKDPEYFTGKSFWDVYSKEQADYRFAVVKRVFQTGEKESVEVVVPLHDKTLYFWATSNPIKDDSGKVIMNLTHATDITERKKAELALEELNNFNSQVIQSAQEGIIVYDLEMKYRVWNPFMEKLSGVSASEVIGKHPLEVFPFLKDAGVVDIIKKAIQGEIDYGIDFPYSLPSGKTGWASDTTAPLKNAKGEVVGAISTVREITERKEAEALLKKKKDELEYFNSFFVDRELKMLELKREINDLVVRAGGEKRYNVS